MKKLLIINTLPENAPAVSPALEVLRGGAEEVRVIHTYEKNLRPCAAVLGKRSILFFRYYIIPARKKCKICRCLNPACPFGG